MQDDRKIFFAIAAAIRQLRPDAEIRLFGSRANNTATAESDWDILVLLNEQVTMKVKQEIHDAVFPISLSANAFINTLIVSEADWNNNPAYYSIHQSVQHSYSEIAK